MKRIIALLLIISIILPILPVYADGEAIKIRYIDDYAYAYFTTTVSEGTSTTRFGTHGWNISFGSYKFLYDIEFNPDLSIEYEIPLIDGSGLPMASIQSRIKSKHGENSEIYKAWMNLMQTGGTIKFDASIHRHDIVNGKRKIVGPRANTLEQALALANWSDNAKYAFENYYYNRYAYVNSQPVPPPTGEPIPPIADMAFSDTDSTIKYITEGESVTVIDKSYTLEPDKNVIKWLVEIVSTQNGVTKTILPKQWITNPDEFFKTYNFPAAGTYEIILHQVEQD